jgi:hypothetical protein
MGGSSWTMEGKKKVSRLLLTREEGSFFIIPSLLINEAHNPIPFM